MRFDGKVALVTGASKGIGKALAGALAANGAKVMLSSRKQDALEAAAAEMEGDTAVFAGNAGDPVHAAACVAATIERFGAVDILINNAATNPYFGPVLEVDLPRYDKTFEVNLRGPLVWMQECWRRWMGEHGGNIVNIASIGGMSHPGGLGIYDTTKAALIYLTRHVATEVGPRVRVNAIAPGVVKTDMARELWERGRAAEKWPLGRFGVPEDIVGAALFLVSDLSSWVTGHVLVVDGGALLGGFPV